MKPEPKEEKKCERCKDWKSCENPFFDDSTIRPCYKCGIDTQFCQNCKFDHHIELCSHKECCNNCKGTKRDSCGFECWNCHREVPPESKSIERWEEEFSKEFGDIWQLDKPAELTESGCPSFVRINRQVKSFIAKQLSLARKETLEEVEKIAEEMKKPPAHDETEEFEREIPRGYNQALSDLIKRLEEI